MSPPSTSQKVHLSRGRRSACGVIVHRNGRPNLPTTTVPGEVTCKSCQHSLAMALAEIEQRQQPRRR